RLVEIARKLPGMEEYDRDGIAHRPAASFVNGRPPFVRRCAKSTRLAFRARLREKRWTRRDWEKAWLRAQTSGTAGGRAFSRSARRSCSIGQCPPKPPRSMPVIAPT